MNDTENPLDELERELTERRQRQFLPSSVVLEETQNLPSSKLAVIVICAAVVLTFLWAAITQVDETAHAFGEVIPKGQVKVVQHLEGGIIEKILVKDGDKVIAGKTVIARLDPVNALSELHELQSREIALLIDAERLRAFATEKEIEFKEWIASFIKNKKLTTKQKLLVDNAVRDELLLFDMQTKARIDQREILLAQIKQRNEESQLLLEQKDVLKRHLELLSQEKSMYDKLQTVSKRDFLEVLRQMNKANGDLTNVILSHQKNKSALYEAQNRLSELNSSLRERSTQELDDINAQLSQLRNRLTKLETRVKRLDIIATETGLINDIQVSVGTVLRPGGKICEIVPINNELVVEAQIPPKDIGHIKKGDKVKVKVHSYDFSRYGVINGVLSSVSATTYQDEEGVPYYKGIIKLSKQHAGTTPGKLTLKSGMTVEADIITGSKSLLKYLLKPIQVATMSAFHER